MVDERSNEDNIEIRFYSKLTAAGSDLENTLKSGWPFQESGFS